MNKTLWVTGAKGFIGRHAALMAAKQGFTVLGLGFGTWCSTEQKSWGLTQWVYGSVNQTNLRVLYQLSGRPSYIIHLAGGVFRRLFF